MLNFKQYFLENVQLSITFKFFVSFPGISSKKAKYINQRNQVRPVNYRTSRTVISRPTTSQETQEFATADDTDMEVCETVNSDDVDVHVAEEDASCNTDSLSPSDRNVSTGSVILQNVPASAAFNTPSTVPSGKSLYQLRARNSARIRESILAMILATNQFRSLKYIVNCN